MCICEFVCVIMKVSLIVHVCGEVGGIGISVMECSCNEKVS